MTKVPFLFHFKGYLIVSLHFQQTQYKNTIINYTAYKFVRQITRQSTLETVFFF